MSAAAEWDPDGEPDGPGSPDDRYLTRPGTWTGDADTYIADVATRLGFNPFEPDEQRAVDDVVGTLGLEGITVPDSDMPLLLDVASGRITADAAVATILESL